MKQYRRSPLSKISPARSSPFLAPSSPIPAPSSPIPAPSSPIPALCILGLTYALKCPILSFPLRGRAEVARRAHNPEVSGSNPLPATKETSVEVSFLSYVGLLAVAEIVVAIACIA